MGVVKNLLVRAGADFSAITKQSQKASQSMQSMSASISKATSRINNALSAVGIGISVAAIVAAGKSAVEAYKAQGEAEAKLAQVMKTTMGAADGEIRAIKQLTEAQEQLGIVGADVQQAGAQELATYLTSSKSLETLIPVMNDMVAQQYGYSASAEQAANIATMLGKVIEGQTGGLSRYGYYFDDAQKKILKYGTEAERVATLAEIVEGSVGGMNFALANTPIGRMQQLSNTMGNIKAQLGEAIVTVGTVFLPLLNKVANLLAGIASLAMRVAQAIANIFGKKISPSAAAVAGGAGEAADSFDDMAESAGGAGKAAKEAAKSVLGFDELNKLTDNKSTSGGGGAAAAGGGAGAIAGLADAEDEAAESATWLERSLQRVKDLVTSLDFGPLKASWDSLTESARHLGSVVLDYLDAAWDNVMVPLAHWTIEDLAPELVELLAQAVEFLATVLERLEPTAKWLWENILQPLAEYSFDLIIDSLEYIRQKLSDLTDLISGKTTFKDWLDTLTPLEKILGSIGISLLVVSVATALSESVTKKFSTAITLVKGAFSLLTSPLGLVVAGIALLVLGFISAYQNSETFREKIDGLKEKLQTLSQSFKGLSLTESLKKVFDDLTTWMSEFDWSDFSTKIRDGIVSAFGTLGEAKDNIKAKIQEKLGEVDFASIAESFWTFLFTAIKTAVSAVSALIVGVCQAFWEQIRLNLLANDEDGQLTGGEIVSGILKGITDKIVGIGSWIVQNIYVPFINGFKNAFGIHSPSSVMQEQGDMIMEGLLSGITEKIETVKEKFGEIKDGIKEKMDEAKDTVSGILDDIKGFFQNFSLGDIHINMPHFSVVWNPVDSSIARFFGVNSLPSLQVDWYANGGFPDVGQLFMANENGPELVGSFGSNANAVANNDQIIAGIRQGVYEAVSSAMSNSSFSAKVYLDSREIKAGQDRLNRAMGV